MIFARIRSANAIAWVRAYLAAHDSYRYFSVLSDLVKTGPTLTNVNDIRAIIIV